MSCYKLILHPFFVFLERVYFHSFFLSLSLSLYLSLLFLTNSFIHSLCHWCEHIVFFIQQISSNRIGSFFVQSSSLLCLLKLELILETYTNTLTTTKIKKTRELILHWLLMYANINIYIILNHTHTYFALPLSHLYFHFFCNFEPSRTVKRRLIVTHTHIHTPNRHDGKSIKRFDSLPVIYILRSQFWFVIFHSIYLYWIEFNQI